MAVDLENSPPILAGKTDGRREPVLLSARAVILGLIGVLFISILTPFNDYIVNNTSLVGSVLPAGFVLFFLVFVVCVNTPLWRWMPRWALGQGEMALAMGMTLVSCAIPGSALLKYVPAHLVGIWAHTPGNGTWRKLLDEIHLPNWMFPTMSGTDALSRARDPVVRDYIGRVPVAKDTFLAHWNAVPWHAWLVPAVTWGLLFGCIFAAAIFMAVLVRRQWVDNERLSFPLADLCVSLIEDPAPGRAINATLRSRVFLVAFFGVFFVRGLNAMHEYWPDWPMIPMNYDLSSLTTNPPWTYLDPDVTKGAISFLIIGITYFIQSRIALSVWACMLLLQPIRLATQYSGTDWPGPGLPDQLMGSIVVYALMIVWLGRKEWQLVLRRMVGRKEENDPAWNFLPYGVAGWGFLLSTMGIVVWLILAGASWFGSISLVVLLLTLLLVLMRIVAETGICAIQFLLHMYRPWQYLFQLVPSVAASESSLKPYFLAQFFDVFFTVTQRESIGVLASHSLRIGKTAAPRAATRRWQGVGLVASLGLALAVGYVTAGGSLLFYEYKYSATLDAQGTAPVNAYGVGESATYALDHTSVLMELRAPQQLTFNPVVHLVTGASVTAILAALTLRYAWWPIHPLGYLLLFSWTTWVIWFSIFLGWLAKSAVLKLGGSKLYRASRPFFIGLVFGECAAVGFWLCVSLVCVMFGWQYHAIHILPF